MSTAAATAEAPPPSGARSEKDLVIASRSFTEENRSKSWFVTAALTGPSQTLEAQSALKTADSGGARVRYACAMVALNTSTSEKGVIGVV